MKISIYSDGANLDQIIKLAKSPKIKGITTNPSLMRKSGVTDYLHFCRTVCLEVKNKPISFEVVADEQEEMYRQALILGELGDQVYVKIPHINTRGESMKDLIKKLVDQSLKLNITAVTTLKQVEKFIDSLPRNNQSIISLFSGRIADTGIDPKPVAKSILELMKDKELSKCELLWASTREVFNIYEAEQVGCHIITATADIIKKLDLKDKDLDDFSRETVKMFYNDALSSGFEF
tara:strand:- start:4543 stop:5247 length:705 start_codon:yes stop_codon:yes gene_type:complete